MYLGCRMTLRTLSLVRSGRGSVGWPWMRTSRRPPVGASVASRHKRVFQLVVGSLAASKQRSYAQSWQEFVQSGAKRRGNDELWRRTEDVVQFLLDLMDRGFSRVTIAGKLAGIAFMGKLCGGMLRKPANWGGECWKTGLVKEGTMAGVDVLCT